MHISQRPAYIIRLSNTLCLVLVCLSMMLVSCGRDLSDTEYLDRATRAFNQGDLTDSMVELKNALKVNPENAEARLLLGKVYLEFGDGKSAEKELRRAQEITDSDELTYLPLANSFFLQRRYPELLESFQVLDSVTPEEQAELHTLRGRSYLYNRQLKLARAEFDQALFLNNEMAPAKLGHALADQLSGDQDSARSRVQEVLALKPDSAEAYELLGNLEEASNDLQAAEAAYSQALANSDNDGRYFLLRALTRIQLNEITEAEADIKKIPAYFPGKSYAQGLIEFREQKYSEAQISFEQALTKNNQYAPALYYLGVTHLLQGHEEQAYTYLRDFLRIVPESSSAESTLASLHLRKGDFDSAESLLQSSLDRYPDDKDALALLAGLKLSQGERTSAIAIYQRLLALDPKSVSALGGLGMALMAQGDLEQGTAELNKAIELAPESDKLTLALVLSQLNAGDNENALATSRKWTAEQPESIPANLSLGYALLANKEYLEAREIFKQVLIISPGSPTASHNLAVLAEIEQKYDEAQAYYQGCLDVYPNHAGTKLSLSRLYLRLGERGKAVALLEELTDQYPNEIAPSALLGTNFVEHREFNKALEVTQDASSAHPDNLSLLAIRGAAQAENRNYTEATAIYERMTRLNPQSAHYHYLLAQSYYKLRELEKFSHTLEEAYRLDPKNQEIGVAMASLLIGQRKFTEAQKIIDSMLAKQADFVEGHVLSGQLAAAMNEPQKSADDFRQALSLAPGRSDLAVKYALSLLLADEPDKATTTLEDWLINHPGDDTVRYNLANLYLATGKDKEATVLFKEIVDEQPEHVIALNNLAWHLRKSQPEKALDYAERAYSLAPDQPAVQDTLAMLLMEQGDQNARAVRLLEKASSSAPENPRLKYHLALALSGNDEAHRAKKVLEELVQSGQEFPEKQQALALFRSLDGN